MYLASRLAADSAGSRPRARPLPARIGTGPALRRRCDPCRQRLRCSIPGRAALWSMSGRACSPELGEPIQGPGQMTYGSQAAAATQVFEQQRDLALRDHEAPAHARRTPRWPRSTTARTGRAGAAASRSPRRGWKPFHGRRRASTARASPLDDRSWPWIRRRRSGGPRSRIDDIRTPPPARRARRRRDSHTARRVLERPPRVLLKAESLQSIGAFKIRGAYHAIAPLTAAEASAGRGHPLVRQPRPGRRAGGAGARNPRGDRDARRTRPRSSAAGSRPTAPRSSRSGRPAASARRWRIASSPSAASS